MKSKSVDSVKDLMCLRASEFTYFTNALVYD